MREAVIVEALRTPIGKGKPGGALSGWHPADLLGQVLSGLIDKTGIDPASVDDVITGCVSQAGQQAFNVGRHGVLAAGFPESVPATSVDRQCGSSQQALHFAAQGIVAGAYEVAIAAGVEVMSRVPMFSSTMGQDAAGPRVTERYRERGGLLSQGISAELIAAKWGLSRADLDWFSAESHRRAAAATDEGRFAREILPIPVDRGEGETGEIMTTDEGIRPDSSPETLGALKPAFYSDELAAAHPEIQWMVTAGGSSQISDGAAAVLLMERAKAESLGLMPRAVVREFAVVGDDPIFMLTGVIPATEKVLRRAGLSIVDIDAFEVNEAFAPVVLSWQRETGADLRKVNVHGGAIANGHPLGASGAKLTATLLNVLEQTGGRYGLQTICEGGGMANATIIERLG
ncbi:MULTISPECIES: thiolase family protein [Streptomyces]|uniref:thiolase family protein n=1 Tax=Streptomyces TaxID=1883 RepID=UPI0029BB112F|nr:thiolase family protein [Streptomyces europaeiscabiei]MDX3715728.1 thiolase family protein [Streptomyces europaeiscabiei]WSG20055.1 thiolase family protein [Streptomyces europaeiscabiei]